jgi:hypothetical protein
MTTSERIDRILCGRAALKGVVEEAECVVGIQAALPITLNVVAAIDAMDRAVSALRTNGAGVQDGGGAD